MDSINRRRLGYKEKELIFGTLNVRTLFRTGALLNGNFHTTKQVGRPRTRWADVVQRDSLRLLGIRGWRRRAENRDEWRRLMREAKARKGL
jgi:hypothetical protein